MKSFRTFITEAKNEVKQGQLGPDGVPSVVIMNDRSNLPKPPTDPVQGQLGPDGVPAAVVLNTRRPKLAEDAHQEPHEDTFTSTNHNAHLGNHEDEHEEAMHNLHQHTPEAMEHLHKYSEGSGNLNKHLFDHHINGTEPGEHFKDRYDGFHSIAGLDKATTHHTLGHDLHVYSGTHFHPGEVAAQHPEGHIHLPAYTSTSLSKDTASSFAHSASYSKPDLRQHGMSGHMLHIHLKPGDKGAYLGKRSFFHQEKEFLLPRNTRLKVHPQPSTYMNSAGQAYHVWHAETVKQD